MQLTIIGTDNAAKGKASLPKQFAETIRPDLIKRAVIALQAARKQPYGASPEAGKRSSVRISKRRRDYRGTYGIGQSRTPRKVMSYRGTRFNWTGAFAPQTVGGRRSHPPKASKEWEHKINDKERLKAIRSALAATMDKEAVQARGHKAPDNYPFIIDNAFEQVKKTKELEQALGKIGMTDDLARAAKKKVRAGKGARRGRKYKQATSILLVTANDCPLLTAAANIPGVDAVTVKELNAEVLAPGTVPGRLTLYTQSAIEKLDKEKLFTGRQAKKAAKESPAAKEKPKTAKKQKPEVSA